MNSIIRLWNLEDIEAISKRKEREKENANILVKTLSAEREDQFKLYGNKFREDWDSKIFYERINRASDKYKRRLFNLLWNKNDKAYI